MLNNLHIKALLISLLFCLIFCSSCNTIPGSTSSGKEPFQENPNYIAFEEGEQAVQGDEDAMSEDDVTSGF